jgi:hypothetical protein
MREPRARTSSRRALAAAAGRRGRDKLPPSPAKRERRCQKAERSNNNQESREEKPQSMLRDRAVEQRESIKAKKSQSRTRRCTQHGERVDRAVTAEEMEKETKVSNAIKGRSSNGTSHRRP